MNRRFSMYAAALGLLCLAQVAGAQTQVGSGYFTGPTNHLLNFDTVPSGTLLQNVYASQVGGAAHWLTAEQSNWPSPSTS